jgi:teichuronic acid biosynthesis glycosyltransferase TuaG
MNNYQKFPLFSVIIPTYNSEKYLIETIESVLNQTYPNIEIIVIDDGSTDSTSEILRPYFKDIQYYIIPHSGLPAVPRNYGIAISKGKYIAFLDSDDIWLPDKILKQYDIFLNHNSVGLVSTNALRFYDNEDGDEECTALETLFLSKKYSTGIYQFSDLLCNNFIITSSVVISRDCVEKCGYFSEDTVFRAVEDFHLWLRIALLADIYYLDKPFMRYCDRINSIRSEQSVISNYMRIIWMFSDLIQYMKRSGVSNNKNIRKTYRQQLFILSESIKYCIYHKRISYIYKILLDGFLSGKNNI